MGSNERRAHGGLGNRGGRMNIDQQIKCLSREVERRKKVFPTLIEQGRFSEEMATSEIATMQQAMQTLTQLRGLVTVTGKVAHGGPFTNGDACK